MDRYAAVTFSLDTSAYASGDLLADTQVLTGAAGTTGALAALHSLVLTDRDDQGVALTVVLLSANVSLGTENSAPTITDANAEAILGILPVLAADWVDLGGARIATLRNLGLLVQPAAGSRNLYVALLNGTGTPTFSAGGLVGRFGFLGG